MRSFSTLIFDILKGLAKRLRHMEYLHSANTHILKFFRISIILAFCCSLLPGASSAQDIAIDCDQMPYASMKKLLKKEGINSTSDIERLRPTCVAESEVDQFQYHIKTYFIDAPVEEVWEVYKTINPEEAWKGTIGSYAFMYSREDGKIKYVSDEYPGIREGQIIFLNLRFLRGLFNIAVGQEVTEIDDENKIMKFCYLDNNVSAGSQSFKLESTSDGRTMVIHQTNYRSDSKFRDERLYPVIHSLIIKEYHRSIAIKAESEHQQG